jgi:hypothetical protein
VSSEPLLHTLTLTPSHMHHSKLRKHKIVESTSRMRTVFAFIASARHILFAKHTRWQPNISTSAAVYMG